VEKSSGALKIVRLYFESWLARDFVAAAGLLSPSVRVDVPVNRYATKESFVTALTQFGGLVQETQLIDEFERGNKATLLYDMQIQNLGKLRIAEHFSVADGLITQLIQIHDTYAVRKAGFARLGGRAIADTTELSLLATVDVEASPERVFRALTSQEITGWWVRPGVFDTRVWSGEVHAGGCWKASGVARGQPYALEGKFLEVNSPRILVHTWQGVAALQKPSIVSYQLEPLAGRTRLTLRHSDLSSPEQCINTAIGWETSFDHLVELIENETEESQT
jgi:uncharacterized protein YndB with AHSA1/START domain